MIYLSPIRAQSSNELINLSVTDVILPENYEIDEEYVVFNFKATLNIFNPSKNNISISHPDTCKFKLGFTNISSEVDGYGSSSFTCGQAITIVEYKSGLTTENFTVHLKLKGNMTKIPPGSYYMEPLLPNWDWQQFGQVYGALIVVNVDGTQVIYDKQEHGFSDMVEVPISNKILLASIISLVFINKTRIIKFNK